MRDSGAIIETLQYWKIAQAQQKFAELIEAATQEPQLIYHQERLVAAVVEAELFREFLAWRERGETSSIADVFGELCQVAQEEDYILEISSRQDRPRRVPRHKETAVRGFSPNSLIINCQLSIGKTSN